MSTNNTPIVIVAYNRPRSLLRLLRSVSNANYPHKEITLIISIDKAENNSEVLEIANNFDWQFGTKLVNYNEVNLGLRNHILKCGDISLEYGSVIVLEDDLYVSKNYYEYSKAALDFSFNKDYVGGISLYNHKLNVHNREEFSPIEDGYDNWYFQFASSWGQAWSSQQWHNFKDWYTINPKLELFKSIPANVTAWSNKSWLKFYIAYLINENKYFLYPKISLTTNFSDAGTHVGKDSTSFQVPLSNLNNKKYQFATLEESTSVYNAFYENQQLHEYLNLNQQEVCIDLYAYKPEPEERYWLTTKNLDYKISKSFGRSLKPIDMNIIENISGEEIFLYDTSNSQKNKTKYNWQRKFIYNIKHISLTDALKISYFKILDKLRENNSR